MFAESRSVLFFAVSLCVCMCRALTVRFIINIIIFYCVLYCGLVFIIVRSFFFFLYYFFCLSVFVVSCEWQRRVRAGIFFFLCCKKNQTNVAIKVKNSIEMKKLRLDFFDFQLFIQYAFRKNIIWSIVLYLFYGNELTDLVLVLISFTSQLKKKINFIWSPRWFN